MGSQFAEFAANYYKNLSQDARENLNSLFGGLPDTLLAKHESMKPQEKPQVPKYGITFVKEVSTIPSQITVKDTAIYKNIILKNSGSEEWPSTVFLANLNETKDEKTNLANVPSGKEFPVILTIHGPGKTGKFTSSWRLGYVDAQGNDQFIGDAFNVEFEVIDPDQETPNEEIKKKEYSESVKERAKLLKDLFPDFEDEKLMEIIDKNESMTIEELIDNYLLQ